MAELRPETRVAADLKLRVWGIGADGRGFSQHAHARNISNAGALLCGIEHELNIGETLGLQHGERKVRCQVVWTINTGSLHRTKAGVKLLSGTVCPWTAELLAAQKPASDTPENVRRWNRHKISVRVELHVAATAPLRVNATDISASGCYVETGAPFPIGTPLKVDFWIVSERITTCSIVRTCDPGVGMGIEFVGLKWNERQRFQGYLEALDPWASSIAR